MGNTKTFPHHLSQSLSSDPQNQHTLGAPLISSGSLPLAATLFISLAKSAPHSG